MKLAEKIQQLRKQNNFSQEELADKLGVSRQSISKWESEMSMPEIDKIVQLSELFGVTTDFLLKDEFDFSQNTASCYQNDKPVSSRKKLRIQIAFTCIALSGISLFVIWILSKLFPIPIIHIQNHNEYYLGLRGFARLHGIVDFYNLCRFILVSGIVLLFLDTLKMLWQKAKGKIRRTK